LFLSGANLGFIAFLSGALHPIALESVASAGNRHFITIRDLPHGSHSQRDYVAERDDKVVEVARMVTDR
jgi:hypothetical protein